jgi:hypothetical protein
MFDRQKPFGHSIGAWLLVPALVACGGGGAGEPITESRDAAPETGLCQPGRSLACTGPGGCSGGQICNADGSGWGSCVCDPTEVIDAGPPPPDPGTSPDLDPRLRVPIGDWEECAYFDEDGVPQSQHIACRNEPGVVCRPLDRIRAVCEPFCIVDGPCGDTCTESTHCNSHMTCFDGMCRLLCWVPTGHLGCQRDEICLDIGRDDEIGLCVPVEVAEEQP